MLYEETTLTNESVTCLTLSTLTETVASYGDSGKNSDSLLWDAFRKGDELAFIKIYNHYSLLLYHYGCKFSSDKEMVRDCLHDFFLYLKKNKSGFGETNSIKLYLFKAFRRRIVDYLKKNANAVLLGEPSDFANYPVELSIESVFINKQVKDEQLERLNKGLNALDYKERKAIYYFYYKGMSYEQIAAIFKFTHVSSARRVMYRGLRQLRTYFSYS